MPNPTQPSRYRLYAGVDVAATTATVAGAEPGGTPRRSVTIAQTPQGFATLQQRLADTGHVPAATLIVMEATGGYWVALATTRAQAGFAVSVVNPTQAHHFARVMHIFDDEGEDQIGDHWAQHRVRIGVRRASVPSVMRESYVSEQ